MEPKDSPAGWYKDASNPGERWWDGARWTEHYRQWDGRRWITRGPAPAAPPAPEPQAGAATSGTSDASPPPAPTVRKGPRWVAVAAIVVVGLIALAAALPSEQDPGSAGSDGSSAQSPKVEAPADAPGAPPPPAQPADCGKQATDECTPHVGYGGSVRVDALVWKVTNVRVSKTLGDQTYGFGEKADGRFVVVSLNVHSDKNESATFSSDVAKLEIAGNTYDTDTEGTIAAAGSGDDPFIFEDIGPDSDVKGQLVFDVPARVLSRKVELRFNELGFGSTHGYIRLPSKLLR